MKALDALDQVVAQAEFAQMIGVSEARVSQLMSEGWLARGETAANWLLAYCDRLRDQAAGRLGFTEGGLDPAQENAALKRAQREGVNIENAKKRGEYTSIKLLAEVLADANQSVVERFDQLTGQLRKTCPDLPPAAIDKVLETIASARNEWVRSTCDLVAQKIENDSYELPDFDTESAIL